MTEREVKDALPTNIPYYSFHSDRVSYNAVGRPTPGKSYLDPQDILVKVYNSTIAKDGGFSGEVLALGSHIDSFGANDYVFGGGVSALQQYITVRAEEVLTKPRDLCFADASRLHAGTILYEHLQHLQQELTVLILGDMTGFGAQICRERGCLVTSSEYFDCGEQAIIDSDNFLEWLENHDFVYDVVVDATGDLDMYAHCHKFTTKRAHYISINPDSVLQATKSAYLPSFLGGGTRKLTIARPAKGAKKVQLLAELAAKIVREEYEVKNPRIVGYRSIHTVNPSQRYVTAVNVIEQKDITPEDPEYNLKEGRARGAKGNGKGKAKARTQPNTPPRYRNPTFPSHTQHRPGSSGGMEASGNPSRQRSTPSSPVVHPYSPKVSSRLSHSVSASILPDSSPPMISSKSESRKSSAGSITANRSPSVPDPSGSPKMSIMRTPPLSRRHTSSMVHDDLPFEQIELQSLMSSGDINDEESVEDDDVARPLTRYEVLQDDTHNFEQNTTQPQWTSEPESGDDAEHDNQVHGDSVLPQADFFAEPPLTKVPSDENGDVSEVDIDAGLSKAEELRRAQEQIDHLQKQVARLMQTQGASSAMKETAGLGLMEI